jgi:hypothetical protein
MNARQHRGVAYAMGLLRATHILKGAISVTTSHLLQYYHHSQS